MDHYTRAFGLGFVDMNVCRVARTQLVRAMLTAGDCAIHIQS